MFVMSGADFASMLQLQPNVSVMFLQRNNMVDVTTFVNRV